MIGNDGQRILFALRILTDTSGGFDRPLERRMFARSWHIRMAREIDCQRESRLRLFGKFFADQLPGTRHTSPMDVPWRIAASERSYSHDLRAESGTLPGQFGGKPVIQQI